jgi:Fungal N-terminal domain of STAND proteins
MDPLSITVSILTLATICVQSSASLYGTIDSFKSRKQDVRILKTEVGALNIVLQALEKNIEESSENFEVLRIILQHCHQACKDFEKTVLEEFRDSGSRLQEIKAWAKLQYLGNDINKFRKLIGSYKATMTVALADANLYDPSMASNLATPYSNIASGSRTSKITKQLLEEYSEMTKDATADLEEQISELNTKLEHFKSSSCRLENQSGDNLDDFKQVQEKKNSLEQCVVVCRQLLDHIEDVKLSVLERDAGQIMSGIAQDADLLAPRLTVDALKICTQSLNVTQQQLRDLQSGDRSTNGSDEVHVLQELNSTRRCLDLVERARYRVNTFENINIAEDSFSTAVSTMGDLIKARGLTIGARSVNIMGQMNDESLQKVSYNFRQPVPEKSVPTESTAKFEERHGFGQTISKRK